MAINWREEPGVSAGCGVKHETTWKPVAFHSFCVIKQMKSWFSLFSLFYFKIIKH